MNNKQFIFLTIFIANTIAGMDIIKIPCWRLHQIINYNSPIQSLQFNPVDNNHLAIASDKSTIALININTHEEIMSLSHPRDTLVESLCFSRSGKLLATTTSDNYAHVFDISNKNIEPIKFLHNRSVTSACFSLNEQYLATREKYSEKISIFDLRKKQISQVIIGISSDLLVVNINEPEKMYTLSHNNQINSVYCDPFDNTIITASNDGVRIFTLNENNIYTLNTTFLHDHPVQSIDYNHEKKILVTRTSNGKARLFDLNTQQEITSFSHEEFIQSIVFDHSGNFLAIGSDSGKIRIFTTTTLNSNE